jgi:hypothetical protein
MIRLAEEDSIATSICAFNADKMPPVHLIDVYWL